jgi:hypothetical protein
MLDCITHKPMAPQRLVTSKNGTKYVKRIHGLYQSISPGYRRTWCACMQRVAVACLRACWAALPCPALRCAAMRLRCDAWQHVVVASDVRLCLHRCRIAVIGCYTQHEDA